MRLYMFVCHTHTITIHAVLSAYGFGRLLTNAEEKDAAVAPLLILLEADTTTTAAPVTVVV